MLDKAKPEHAFSSPAEPADLLTRIVDFGREVLAPSPHTPRTNLARWGEGCKPYVVASDLPGVLSNIARFGEKLRRAVHCRSDWPMRDLGMRIRMSKDSGGSDLRSLSAMTE